MTSAADNPTSRYVLVDRQPVAEPDLARWAAWFEQLELRRVAVDVIGRTLVSTVCIGVDTGIMGGDPPILFETLVLWGPHHGHRQRYATWDEAERGHAAVAGRLRGLLQ